MHKRHFILASLFQLKIHKKRIDFILNVIITSSIDKALWLHAAAYDILLALLKATCDCASNARLQIRFLTSLRKYLLAVQLMKMCAFNSSLNFFYNYLSIKDPRNQKEILSSAGFALSLSFSMLAFVFL